ncbi:hemolysin family protein [Syntrophus aciditrophicus]|uniref:Magnesium and cobalt efflux protein n=1 Tax=Syntrophus aciditrophicus (strain SB) TaxID=56780 RepID=Q2LW63_SYNAS|nr:hemolysin family protein [Syntrophus aciditrophicus]ABC78319.1 magnesium and cobalt efflux protein [Syntrophus aciditrophicus SB]OPY14117.1 MAG: Magnesium and cobalt efflux protein CorC [Syntrophus sp. PtaB.Bin075]
MNTILFEISIIVFLIILNGLLALSELALVSASRVRLERLAKEGDSKALTALELADTPDSFLSTIQIGITFVGILAGAFGGATLAGPLTEYFAVFPMLAPYAPTISIAVVVVCITYLSIVIGELVPKRLALSNPEKLARLVAVPIKRLSRLAHPLVLLLSASTNLTLRIFHVQPSTEPVVTEEEIRLLIDKGTQAGTFQEFEQDTIERVFRLADRRVAYLMTPKSEIVWLDLDESQEVAQRKIAEHKYSFYPLVHDTLDNVVGVIRAKELLALIMEGKPFNLKSVCRKPLYVSETTPAVKVLELFKKSGMHIAFVVDEYGAILGLVTFDDILHSVFEDIEEGGNGEKEIVEREDGSWLISGSLPLDEFMDYMEIGEPDEDELTGMNTVGGFVMTMLGTVPAEGQHFIWRGLRCEVVDMDGRRVDKIIVSRLEG